MGMPPKDKGIFVTRADHFVIKLVNTFWFHFSLRTRVSLLNHVDTSDEKVFAFHLASAKARDFLFGHVNLIHNVLVDNTSKGNASGSVVELIDYEATIQLHDNAILNRTAEMLFLIDSRIQSETRRFPEYLTRDVADNLATAFADVMPSPFGVDIYMSTQLGLALATGFISDTSGSNTRGQIINVYAPYWQYGRQRQIQVDTVWDALSGSTVVVVSVSHVLAARGASAATMTYNLVAPA